MKVSNCCGASPRAILGRHGEIDNDTETFGLCPECGEHCEYEEVAEETNEQILLYFEIKKAFYIAKQKELKRQGITWSKFKELESIVKDNWQKLAEKGYIELGEGLIAVGVDKELRVFQGKGQVIGKELTIQIHQKQS
jgi:hypothetical protein